MKNRKSLKDIGGILLRSFQIAMAHLCFGDVVGAIVDSPPPMSAFDSIGNCSIKRQIHSCISNVTLSNRNHEKDRVLRGITKKSIS